MENKSKFQTITISARDIAHEQRVRRAKSNRTSTMRTRGGVSLLTKEAFEKAHKMIFEDGAVITDVIKECNIGQTALAYVMSHPEWATYEEYQSGVDTINATLKKLRDEKKERELEERKKQLEQEAEERERREAERDAREFAKIDYKKLKKLEKRVDELELTVRWLKTQYDKEHQKPQEPSFNRDNEMELVDNINKSDKNNDNDSHENAHQKKNYTQVVVPQKRRPWFR